MEELDKKIKRLFSEHENAYKPGEVRTCTFTEAQFELAALIFFMEGQKNIIDIYTPKK